MEEEVDKKESGEQIIIKHIGFTYVKSPKSNNSVYLINGEKNPEYRRKILHYYL